MKENDADGKTFLYKSLLTRVPYPPLTRSPFPDGEGKLVAATPQIFMGRCPKVVSSHQPLETTHPCFQTTGFNGFKGFWWRLHRDPSTQVAAVLAFVISHTTFLAAQDDETGQCSKAGG